MPPPKSARLTAISELAALVGSTLDPQRVFEIVAEATSRLLDGAAATIWGLDERGGGLVVRASHAIEDEDPLAGDVLRGTDSAVAWVFQRQKALCVPDDVADLPTVSRRPIEPRGLRAFVGVPLLQRGRCLGVVSAWRRATRPFGAEDVELLKGFALHAAAAIENADLHGRMAAEWERLRILLEMLPAGVMVEEGTADGREFHLLMANRAAKQLLRTDGSLFGARTAHFEFLHPEGTPLQDDQLPLRQAILRGKTFHDLELTVRFPDGSLRSLLCSARPLSEAVGLRQAIAVFQDITDRKRAVDDLRAHSRQQEAVAGLGQDALAGMEPAALFQKTVGVVAEVLGVEYSDVLELVPEGDTLVMRAGRGWREGTARATRVSAGADSQPGYTLMTNDPVVVQDIRAETRFAAPGLHEHGIVSSMTVIIPGRRRPYGVLGAYTARQRRFTDDDIHFLQAVANVLATAIERRLAEDELSKAAAENRAFYERAETERRWLRTILDAIPEAVVVGEAGPGGQAFRLVMANRARAQILGTVALTTGARTPLYEFFRPDGAPMTESDLPLRRAILGESVRGAEYDVRLADGTQRALRAHAVPLPAPEGKRQAVAVVQDITERKRAEDELKRLAAENEALYERAAREAHVKGLLLDELNHRVRNNLALIVSLMELQRANPAGRSAAEVLDDGIARVKGLALLHDLLGGAGVHFGDYKTLARKLADQTLLNGQVGGRVTFRLEAVPLALPSAQLTALGLVTNELFINIAKHAFPNGQRGTVEVTVESNGSDATVRIRDDGVGIPPGPAEAPGRLGLSLVLSLVEVSLQGTFALESGPGTTAVIRFPLPETSPATA